MDLHLFLCMRIGLSFFILLGELFFTLLFSFSLPFLWSSFCSKPWNLHLFYSSVRRENIICCSVLFSNFLQVVETLTSVLQVISNFCTDGLAIPSVSYHGYTTATTRIKGRKGLMTIPANQQWRSNHAGRVSSKSSHMSNSGSGDFNKFQCNLCATLPTRALPCLLTASTMWNWLTCCVLRCSKVIRVRRGGSGKFNLASWNQKWIVKSWSSPFRIYEKWKKWSAE